MCGSEGITFINAKSRSSFLIVQHLNLLLGCKGASLINSYIYNKLIYSEPSFLIVWDLNLSRGCEGILFNC